ncbi:MAG: response regulator transcription factor [Candidatus Eremiobacteraeota bacterium]|nr:response regulator transcription factor [Candidatus Eremiobacteraeota bacterium]
MSNETKTKILVVDDETSIIDYLRLGFKYEGFDVASALNGQDALELVRSDSPDLVVLDRMLPDLDGLTVCQRIRTFTDVPILMLSARGEVEDRVEGLQKGADDYLPKPFEFEELLARVQALLRRSGRISDSKLLTYGPLELDPRARRLRSDGDTVELTAREFEILELLMSHQGQVMTREQLITRLWGFDFEGNTSVVEVHISALRSKLGDENKEIIRTVRGVGYVLGG